MLRFPPRRVLVAVDFTKASVFAWKAAKEIAARFGSTLEAVWCVPSSVVETAGLDPLPRRPGYRARGLLRLRALYGEHARVHAVDGDPARVLLRLARDRAADLIVMGSRRRSGLLRWAEGSTAETVVHGAPCPVLVVPRSWRAPRWILAPVHGKPYARRGLLAAAVLARAYKGRLAMLEVVADPEDRPRTAARVGARVNGLPAAVIREVRPELEVRVGKPVEEILRAEVGRDLIVLVAHRKSLLGDMVMGTTVERVMRHTHLPVLAIPSR